MSDRPGPIPVSGPPDQYTFYSGWLSREKPESDLYRWITTTAGVTDNTHNVLNVEKAARDFMDARKGHLRDLLEGWDQLQQGLNYEIAQKILSEVLSGTRTLADFETRNFSKKNQLKTRESFPAHYSGNPIMLKETVATLEKNQALPTTQIIFQSQFQEYFLPKTSNMYYDLIFGDSKIFHDIMQRNSKTPNMPAPQVHPMPYTAEMISPHENSYSAPPPQFQPIYPQMMQQPMQVQYVSQQMLGPPVTYHLLPQYFQMVPPPPMPIQDNYMGQQNYQHGYQPQGNVNDRRLRRGPSNRSKVQNPGQMQENENVTTSSSSSSSMINNALVQEEEGPSQVVEEVQEKAEEMTGPSTSAESTSTPAPVEKEAVESEKSEEVLVAKPEIVEAAEPVKAENVAVEASVASPSASTAETTETVVSTVRKFSDVVSSKVKKSESGESTSTDQSEAVIVEEKPEEKAKVSEQASEPTTAPATAALVVDTTEQTPAVPPPTSRTLAEIVQQSLSAAPSPAVAMQNGKSSSQPSPMVKANGSQASPAVHTDSRQKPANGVKRMSISYAEMLSFSTKTNGQSSSSSGQDRKTEPKDGEDEWQTVNPKKAAEPIVLETAPKLIRAVAPKKQVAQEPSESDDEVHSDDPDAEKKRQRRREKRQKLKEANRQQKQNEKEKERQESLARVDAMNANAPRQPTPPPAFDRNNLAARRRKRQELQNKTQRSTPTVETPTPPTIPMLPILKGQSLGTISTGPTMAAYGLPHISNQFRHSASPLAIIAPDCNGSIPLFLADQVPLRIASFDEAPVQLTRQLDVSEVVEKKTDIDENAVITEKLLQFDTHNQLETLDCSDTDRVSFARGIEDLKRMYVRVEKAGKLIAYNKGCSKVSPKTEEKLVNLSIKLLSNKLELSSSDDAAVDEIAKKVTELSMDFNYTNFLSALLNFSEERAVDVPDGTTLRRNYEQTVVLTKVFLKRTKTLYGRISKCFDFDQLV